jgi:hypothetical protein
MAIEHSTPMPQRFRERRECSSRNQSFLALGSEAWDEANAFTYEIAWIPERQYWRSVLCSVSNLA